MGNMMGEAYKNLRKTKKDDALDIVIKKYNKAPRNKNMITMEIVDIDQLISWAVMARSNMMTN